MAGAISQFIDGAASRSNMTPLSATGMEVADYLVGGGGSYLMARATVRYADKWYGEKLPEVLGGVFGPLGLLATVFLGPGWFSSTLNSLGRIGTNGLALGYGLKHERQKQGIATVKVPAGTKITKGAPASGLPAGSTMMGALGSAPAGRGLPWDHIAELQQTR